MDALKGHLKMRLLFWRLSFAVSQLLLLAGFEMDLQEESLNELKKKCGDPRFISEYCFCHLRKICPCTWSLSEALCCILCPQISVNKFVLWVRTVHPLLCGEVIFTQWNQNWVVLWKSSCSPMFLLPQGFGVLGQLSAHNRRARGWPQYNRLLPEVWSLQD